MKFIPLSNSDRFAIVDDEHFDATSQHEWFLATPKVGHAYARRNSGGQRFMHRVIAELCGMRGEVIDHINRNGLDNRSANLRGCSYMENSWNSVRKLGVSGVPGLVKAKGGWVVKFVRAKRSHYFGYYRDLNEAREVAKAALLSLRGDFAPAEHREAA